MTEMNSLKLKCLRCGHEWLRRVEHEPIKCPACASPYWNKERKKKGEVEK